MRNTLKLSEFHSEHFVSRDIVLHVASNNVKQIVESEKKPLDPKKYSIEKGLEQLKKK